MIIVNDENSQRTAFGLVLNRAVAELQMLDLRDDRGGSPDISAQIYYGLEVDGELKAHYEAADLAVPFNVTPEQFAAAVANTPLPKIDIADGASLLRAWKLFVEQMAVDSGKFGPNAEVVDTLHGTLRKLDAGQSVGKVSASLAIASQPEQVPAVQGGAVSVAPSHASAINLSIEDIGAYEFFVALTNEGELLTRNGFFRVDPDGSLVTVPGGDPVMSEDGPIHNLPSGTLTVASDGTFSVDGKAIGKLKIVTMAPGTGLRKRANNYLSAPPESLSPAKNPNVITKE